MAKRYDNKHRLLKEGERQRQDGTYEYRYNVGRKRHSIYAPTLIGLRAKEDEVKRDKLDGIDHAKAETLTVKDAYKLWCEIKRGLKDNTFQNYKYMFEHYALDYFDGVKLKDVTSSEIRRFYIYLAEEYGLKVTSMQNIQTVFHQLFQNAIQDNILRINSADEALKELKLEHKYDGKKRRALTLDEQRLFMTFLHNSEVYRHWEDIFIIFLFTGLRVGELTGLRWKDIDLERGIISVNHTLVYYPKGHHCRYQINSPKTERSTRVLKMPKRVLDAFRHIKLEQEENGVECITKVDGYTGFIFINRFGEILNLGVLNKALKRIVRDCNEQVLNDSNGRKDIVLLPHISCHIFRHTLATRYKESGRDAKVIQSVLGHVDEDTTNDVYIDVTQEYQSLEVQLFEKYMDEQIPLDYPSFTPAAS